MRYARKYIQFRDLVFEGVDADNATTSFKDYSTEYTFRHGEYSPDKGSLLTAGQVSMTLNFDLRRLACDERKYFHSFVIENLSRQGRLWAVQDETLLWTWAKVTSFTETGTDIDLEFDVNFRLPEGVWHKASQYRTFLVPYDKCLILDKYREDECNCCGAETRRDDCCCCDPTEDMALVHHKGDVKDLTKCEKEYQAVYDCVSAERYFGGFDTTQHFGKRFCASVGKCGEMSNIITGRLWSDTEIDTDAVIRLHGKMTNPEITINGNTNIIKGEYDGVLTINPDGTILYGDEYCDEELDIGLWYIPSGNTYGWTIHPGENRIVINMNNCESVNCAYIEVDALTV